MGRASINRGQISQVKCIDFASSEKGKPKVLNGKSLLMDGVKTHIHAHELISHAE